MAVSATLSTSLPTRESLDCDPDLRSKVSGHGIFARSVRALGFFKDYTALVAGSRIIGDFDCAILMGLGVMRQARIGTF